MRRPFAAILLIVLLPALVLVNASSWALRTALDDAVFAATVGRVMDDAAVEGAIADRATTAILETLDEAPGRLGTVTTVVLGLTGQPTREQIETALHARILAALRLPAVSEARDAAVAAVHAFLLGAVLRDAGLVTVRGDQVILDLSTVVERAAASIDERLPRAGLAEIPAARAQIVLGEADGLETVVTALDLLHTLQLAIPIAVLAIVVAILALAHRRTRALGVIGVTMMIAGLASIVVAWAGGSIAATLPDDPTAALIAGRAYDAFVEVLVIQSLLLVAVGLLIALLAWIAMSRRAPAEALPPSSA